MLPQEDAMEPTTTAARVRTQYEQFLAALPRLLRDHAGRWAVWLDGLQSVHDTEEDAERWALARYEDDAGFVVAPVETPKPVALSGMAGFRFTS